MKMSICLIVCVSFACGPLILASQENNVLETDLTTRAFNIWYDHVSLWDLEGDLLTYHDRGLSEALKLVNQDREKKIICRAADAALLKVWNLYHMRQAWFVSLENSCIDDADNTK